MLFRSYEMQTNIADHADWAPRVGLVWAPGGAGNKQPKTVVRAGFGLFYDRFGLYNTLTTRLFDGVHQQQYLVTNPDFFPNVPALSALAGLRSKQVLQAVDPNFRSPYAMQSLVTLERQLPGHTTVALTYTKARGFHSLRSLAVNAPLPGSGLFPLGNANPLFLMTGSGLFKQNQVTVNANSRLNRRVSLTGYYTWNKAMSNTDGLGTFPANPYDYTGEYGPAAYDIRHTANAGGSLETKWNIRLNPLITLQSGTPFNITTGSEDRKSTRLNSSH